MKRIVFMFLLVSCICSLAVPGICGQVSLDNQPLSDFETLYNSYKTVVVKSQYETQAQYETRVRNFFQNDPVHYFDLYVSTYYVADTQIFYAYFLDAYAGSCSDIKLPPNYQGLSLKESYDRDSHYLTIDNPNEIGLEKGKSPNPKDSSLLNYVFVYNRNLIPSEAQAMATNIGLRVGIKFNYRADGMLCDRYTAGHYSSYDYSWIDGYYSYYLLGSLQVITLYNPQNKAIYLQKNVNDSNSPPVANAGTDQIVFDKITLDASQSSDPNNDIVSYQWQLQYRGNSAYNRTAEGVNATVSNLQKGFYDVTLTVTDKNGATSTSKMMFSATGSAGGVAGDVNNDGRVGLEDAIYVLQVVSGIRN